MAESDYPNDVQFAGLVEAATQEMHRYGQHETSMAHDREANRTPPSTASRKRQRSPSGSLSQDAIASALFRQPSEKSRRYTRPPMSTLYTSLQLSPESFLRLQASAKNFMLDELYPERRDCVGQRGAGENADMVKLKLWNCVKEFLDGHGHGERYWGQQAGNNTDNQSPRTLLWPNDSQKIIKLCVPLLRRMVTNERQRKYAAVSRRSGEKALEIQRSEAHEDDLYINDEDNLDQIPDMLGEGCTPNSHDASRWYSCHDGQELLHLLRMSDIHEMTLRQIAANLDGHFKTFHRGEVSGCSFMCQQRTLDRLQDWVSPQSTVDSSGDKMGIEVLLGRLLEICKADAQEHVRPLGIELRKSQRQDLSGQSPMKTANASVDLSQHVSKSNLVLHVNVVSNESSSATSSKRIIPRFSLAPESATNLAQLQVEVEKRYNIVSPNGKGRENGFNIKVWLPDGLVPVKDDGEWMVALLSASMVDWMDGEVRVVIEA